MKKQIIIRAIVGLPMGIGISMIISLLISILIGQGKYYPCAPQLIGEMGEIPAVILQTVLSALLGAAFCGGSVVWEIESWSLLKQTVIYFLLGAVTMLPCAYALYWTKRSITGLLIYLLVFIVLFAVIWVIQYLLEKKAVERMNEKLQAKR